MDISDILFSSYMTSELKHALIDLIESNGITDSSALILIPTDSNDDVNGSQHNSVGGTDFTYRDATEEEIANAATIGYYEYFARMGDAYTGHSYQGEDQKFSAIVVDPPAYAVEIHI